MSQMRQNGKLPKSFVRTDFWEFRIFTEKELGIK